MDVQMDGYSSGEEEAARLRAGQDISEESDSDLSEMDKESDSEDDEIVENEEQANDSGSDSDSSVEEDENGELTRVTKETYIPGADQEEEDLEVDEKFYKLLYKATTTFPCMSFDVIPDNLGDGETRANTFPASLSVVGGTYSGKKGQDSLLVMKFSQLKATQKDHELSDEATEDKDESKAKEYEGKMRHVSIPHVGGINRVRTTMISK
jgi:ribosome assembly protein RRB1